MNEINNQTAALPKTDPEPESEAFRRLYTAEEKFDVIYKSSEILVLDKPPDVRIDGDFDVTVEKWVQTEHPDLLEGGEANKLRFCHQLDHATSGILCLAFRKLMAARITHCFQNRTTRKVYLALVHGHPKQGVVHTFDQSIGEDPEDPTGFRMLAGPPTVDTEVKRPKKTTPTKARNALTHAVVLQQGVMPNVKMDVSLVALAPSSGRRHQLRVHCLEWGHPIVGDVTYCPSDKTLPIPRMMLHAWKLYLPVTTSPTDSMDGPQRRSQKRNNRKQKMHPPEVMTPDNEYIQSLSKKSIEDLSLPSGFEEGDGWIEFRSRNRFKDFIQ
eukprot:TRINITY_DN412_c5_g1_i1.p1 TRINITY_DN412_c5_g1~~TRINITY_DN412_c5_g1_i1.p1  ORF type:complete len:327 (+),score=56.60 TRINITY_DN412_c5_g1_i1:32-1012(+)